MSRDNTRKHHGYLCLMLLGVLWGTVSCQPSISNYSLTISSSPDDAKVYVNDRYKGNTPVQLSNIQEQWYVIRIEKEGYLTEETEIWGGSATSKTYTLTPQETAFRSKYQPRPQSKVSLPQQIEPTPPLQIPQPDTTSRIQQPWKAKPSSGSSKTKVQEKRVALIIGNSQYKDVPLQNPVHDAEDIANTLQMLGFTVIIRTNINQRSMDEAITMFVQQIQYGDVALFYFSGHGVQVDGENYLLPVGEVLQSENDIRYKAINAGYLLGKMEESGNRTNIFVLDACRNNPFKGLRSLSKGLIMMDAPGGTFIAYATAPGKAAEDGGGRNSPYTKYLIEALKMKGVSIEQAFKQVLRSVEAETGGRQVPWTSSSLREDFYFNP